MPHGRVDIHVDQQDRTGSLRARVGLSESLLAPTQLEAVAFVDACCRDMVPIAALSGGAGTGKSVTLAAAASQRESLGDRVIRISNFVAGPLSLHRVIAHSLGVADAGELSVDELEPVLRRALAATGRHEPPVLAIDDAQSLLPETLRYLSLLAGLRDGGRPLFRIILVGRPGFTLRQPIPVQANLDAMQPDAARQAAERMLATRGVQAADDAVREIVQHGQGNLRRIDSLVGACAEEVQRSGRKRLSFDMVQVAAGARPQTRKARSRMRPQAWMALPALIAILVAGYGIIRHQDNGPSQPDQATTAPPATPEATASAASTPVTASTAPVIPPPPASASTIPPAPHSLEAPPTPETAKAALPMSEHGPAIVTETLPPPAAQGVTATPRLPAQGPAATPPPPIPSAGSVQGEAASALSKAQRAPAHAAPATKVAQAPATAPAPVAAAVAPPAADVSRFRLYNVGACHHGVCPRWAVLDLNRQSRTFAGFNPAPLGLPQATVQRLREGSLDLIVDGRLAGGVSTGRRLDAVRLVSVEPHHGRAPQPASEEEQSPAPDVPSPGSQPPDNQSPDSQSPPPGYLQAPQGAIRLAPP